MLPTRYSNILIVIELLVNFKFAKDSFIWQSKGNPTEHFRFGVLIGEGIPKVLTMQVGLAKLKLVCIKLQASKEQ